MKIIHLPLHPDLNIVTGHPNLTRDSGATESDDNFDDDDYDYDDFDVDDYEYEDFDGYADEYEDYLMDYKMILLNGHLQT